MRKRSIYLDVIMQRWLKIRFGIFARLKCAAENWWIGKNDTVSVMLHNLTISTCVQVPILDVIPSINLWRQIPILDVIPSINLWRDYVENDGDPWRESKYRLGRACRRSTMILNITLIVYVVVRIENLPKIGQIPAICFHLITNLIGFHPSMIAVLTHCLFT